MEKRNWGRVRFAKRRGIEDKGKDLLQILTSCHLVSPASLLLHFPLPPTSWLRLRQEQGE
ncbi:hypothetical protein COO91_03701 [Nostoc flagelliforme CCNUN1]|uniref:Uncharacterized protein n=1 Tax=Nostoc flagelliforme CCNUN1 TaxID=2038116 RepID=A0A2K8SQL2_9NOSO|nr:hypothetical protein COO91_03701 [Nostoc flagelliforme CCNUN1]